MNGLNSLERSFPDWKIYISSRLNDSEYNAVNTFNNLYHRIINLSIKKLTSSSFYEFFRAENLSLLSNICLI